MRKIPWIFSRKDSILLVESCEEILLVRVIGRRWKEWLVERYSFKVHRANLSVMEWDKIENLGDRILFLSKHNSISVTAAQTGGRGNCIYYIPESTQGKWLVFELGSGILDVNLFEDYDGDIEKFWVMPSS
ncbi:hypothetical protein MRB53_032401 [Persea americana]|uniref:Uncharacterized protein n=1 Tax=Persea americana TaxID=3435 RepID=A0ACC2KSP5_PERAE|nr:hypothetical protein MRB53_032401 [Persea americana]